MATIEKTVNKAGEIIYKVSVSNGRGRRVKRSWRPEPTWSAKTTQRELAKFAVFWSSVFVTFMAKHYWI
ncbi:MAG: hypothetical protein LUC39_05850, partial [Clostridiales bacterium]|nr:hypothetical protein [Clostridiales bacterium]